MVRYHTTIEKTRSFEAVIGVFTELFKELRDLGKRKPETTLSASKVRIINRVLKDIRVCLDGEPDDKYLELLDDETLPQYSDAILVLSQHEGALKSFRSRYYGFNHNTLENGWLVEDV